MRWWILWPSTALDAFERMAAQMNSRIVGRDSVLDALTDAWIDHDVDIVIANILTPGTQDFVEWLAARRMERPAVRWIVALPHPDRDPRAGRWLSRLYSEAVYDWVLDGPDLETHLQERLATPRTWAEARQALGAGAIDAASASLTWDHASENLSAPPADPPDALPKWWRRITAQKRAAWHGRSHSNDRPPRSLSPVAAPPDSFRRGDRPWVMRRRVWLVLGASGGVGVSSIVAALALWWRQSWQLTVGVVDGAAQGGLLGLPLRADLVDQGWEAGHAPQDVWGALPHGGFLLSHGIGPGSLQGTADLLPYLEDARRAPVDVVLVDGGTDSALLGRGRTLWDGILGVVRPEWPGLHAALRMADIWRLSDPFAGVVVNQHREGPFALADWTARWALPVAGVLPPLDDGGQALWRTSQVPDAWTEGLNRITRQMLARPVADGRR